MVYIKNNFDKNNTNITNDDILQYALSNGIINIEDVQEKIAMREREELLSKHPYKVWEGKDGKWYTYLPDEEKGRVLKKRNNKIDIDIAIIDYWKRETENPTVKDIYQEWINNKLNREEISNATKNRYDRQFNESMSVFGKRRIKSVTPFDIENFILNIIYEKSLTQKGYSNLRTLIYGIFRRAKKMGFISYSISEVIQDMEISRKIFRKTNKDDSELIFMQDEVPKIIKYICTIEKNDILSLGILLLFKTGLRPGELAGLEWQDVYGNNIHVCRTEIRYSTDSEKNIYTVRNFPKTEAGIRNVIIPDNAIWIIKEIRRINPFGKYVFEKNGERIKTYQFSQKLETICRRTGIKVKSLNKIRKTYGTILIDANVDESLVISQMGHTNIKTTKTYYYKNRRNEKEMAEIINKVSSL